ncbi:CehA/McbA family metallohydrolase [Bacillaceae bacterium Marseille-Q3522]|nr:CehA/McbA family metallohydrolase [Bacillaceae bacterium Marseille-Q3522]
MSEKRSLAVIKLFSITSSLPFSSVQSHIHHHFYVPGDVDHLSIAFSYTPETLEESERYQSLVKDAVAYYDYEADEKQRRKIKPPLSNLLTISIDDPQGFRGACHRKASSQTLFIGRKTASPGLLSGEIQNGMWSVCVSTHAIVSEKCQYELTIYAHRKELPRYEVYPWRHRPFLENLPNNKETGTVSTSQPSIERRWIPCELHTHTNHSDGQQTLLEMAQHAVKLGLKCVAVTDHNTTSPLQNKQEVEGKTGLKIINGLEWTTFYGHLLTIGYKTNQYTDWRKISVSEIHKGIKEIHELGALAGIAHPFRIGNPIGTGCCWEYEIENLTDFDYLEVWNGEFPSAKLHNQRAYKLWTELLNKGYRMPATSGRDWHHNRTEHPVTAVTYIHLSQNTDVDDTFFQDDLLTSIKEGRMSISMGPLVQLSVKTPAGEYTIGDLADWNGSANRFHVSLVEGLQIHNDIDPESYTIRLVSNAGVLFEKKGQEMEHFHSGTSLRWVRAELYGKIRGISVLIGFTNPIYFFGK